jgi:hypothetical protein
LFAPQAGLAKRCIFLPLAPFLVNFELLMSWLDWKPWLDDPSHLQNVGIFAPVTLPSWMGW